MKRSNLSLMAAMAMLSIQAMGEWINRRNEPDWWGYAKRPDERGRGAEKDAIRIAKRMAK